MNKLERDDILESNKPLLCPFCHKKLVRGEQCRFETLLEHLLDPDREDYPLRDTFVCSCDESKGSFWDDWGCFYNGNFHFHHNTFSSAINSIARKLDEDLEKERKLKRTWIGRLYLKIRTKYSHILTNKYLKENTL